MITLEEMEQLEPGDVVNNAVYLGKFEDGSEDWLALRIGRFGGSDIGTIMGVGYDSPYVFWYQRYGNMSKNPIDPDASYWGHDLEDNIARRFQREHPEYIVAKTGSFEHLDCPLRLTNPDYLLFDAQTGELVGILEIKTSEMGYGYGSPIITPGKPDGMTECPKQYVMQTQSYMDAFELEFAYVAVLIGGRRYREKYIEYDNDREWRNKTVIAFAKSGKDGIPPEYDGKSGTLDMIRAKHPDIEPKEVYYLSQRQRDELIFATAEKQRGEALENKIKAELLDKAGEKKAAKLQLGDKVVAIRTARGKGSPFLQLKEKVSDIPVEAVKK